MFEKVNKGVYNVTDSTRIVNEAKLVLSNIDNGNEFEDMVSQALLDNIISRLVARYFIESKLPVDETVGFATVNIETKVPMLITIGVVNTDNGKRYVNGVIYK